jgi:hypothetical protein
MVSTDAAACARTRGAAKRQVASTRMRRQIGELHRKIKAQVVALERGIEPEGLGANRRSPRLEDAEATAAIGASGGAGRRVSSGGTDLRMTSPGGRRPGHPDRLIERVVAGPTALPAGAAPLRLRHDSWLPGAYNAEATGALPSDSSISPGIDIASKLREATESRGEPSGGQLRGAGLAFPLTTRDRGARASACRRGPSRRYGTGAS